MPEAIFLIDPPPGRGIRLNAPITLYCKTCQGWIPLFRAAEHATGRHGGSDITIKVGMAPARTEESA